MSIKQFGFRWEFKGVTVKMIILIGKGLENGLQNDTSQQYNSSSIEEQNITN